MNFLQKPVGIAENEESIMAYFKKTTLYAEINSYQIEKCLNGWWRIDCMTIGGYVHSTKMLCHFEHGECDLIVGSPTVSFLRSLDLHEANEYSYDFYSPFDKAVFLDEPVNEHDIVNYLEKRYSITGLFQEAKRNDKVLIGKREDGPICEWYEDPGCSDFCIAKVDEDGMVEMILFSPSLKATEYWFFQMNGDCDED